MYREVELFKRAISLIGRYWVALPVVCLLLFPVRCDASPFPHSIFIDPTGADHAGHAHADTAANIPALTMKHAHDHTPDESESCRVVTSGPESTETDLPSMKRVAGSIDGLQAASVPDLNDLLPFVSFDAPAMEHVAGVLTGERPHPPAPPPRLLIRS